MDAATAGVLTTGVLGLAGIVGTFLAPTWSQRRLEQRRETRELRTAQRLVASDLEVIASSLESTVRVADVAGLSKNLVLADLRFDAWTDHRRTLASSLHPDDWAVVAHAYEALESTQNGIAGQESDELDTVWLTFVRTDLHSVRRALDTLRAAKPLPD